MATALPVAFTGIVIIFLFTHVARAFPALGLGHWEELALPAMVLGFAVSGAIARVVYSSLSESLHAPHLLAARARGLGSSWRILWHALRPALPPVVSLTALEAAFLFGGTVITETVFSRPGLGRLLVGAILQGDFPVAQGLVVLGALTYTATGIGADLLATLLDPRLQVDR
jgi:ABC-type dipeptide/oligopeptide/nickel transport system permease component